MVTEVNAVEFGQNVEQLLEQVQSKRDSIVISRDGAPVAALVDAASFERVQRMWARFDEVAAKFAAAFADIPEAEGMAEIDAAVWAERKK